MTRHITRTLLTMNYTQRFHTLRIFILGMIVAWGGILGLAGVACGQVSYEELYAFMQGAQTPTAGVIQDSAGNLYGTTQTGGASGYGTVYKLEPSTGTLTLLHSFNGSDGAFPSGGVIRDSAGNLYGTTSQGGSSGAGTVFRLTPIYTFLGFFPPVDNPPTVNTVKNGATVPLKWKLQDINGANITSVGTVAAGWPKAQKISCATLTAAPEDAIETTGTGGTSLRYDFTSM